jgi:hypothetical protein
MCQLLIVLQNSLKNFSFTFICHINIIGFTFYFQFSYLLSNPHTSNYSTSIYISY